MAVSIQQAACNALGAHLYAQISPEIKISYDWPDPESQLPERGITILLVGNTEDNLLDPEPISFVPIDAVQNMYRWKVLERTAPIQMDIWTTYQYNRDDIIAQLDQLLNTGIGWSDAPGHGLALSLADGWEAVAVFDFDGPSISNVGAGHQLSEWRGTYQGQLRVVLYVDAPNAKLATVKLHQVLDGAAVVKVLT